MAGPALDDIFVIISCFFPVVCVGVANDACTGIVVNRAILQVARLALDDIFVIISRLFPVSGAGVAGDACTRIVVNWGIF